MIRPILLALLTLLSGCAGSARITPVAEPIAIPVTKLEDAGAPRVQGILIEVQPGQDIGALQSGFGCIPYKELLYGAGRYTPNGEQLAGALREELRAADYTVVGEKSGLFEKPTGGDADYLIGGIVTDMANNICHPWGLYDNHTSAMGDASMTFRWKLYDPRLEEIVYEVETQGYGEISDPYAGGEVDMILAAFRQAARHLLAKSEFHGLVTGS